MILKWQLQRRKQSLRSWNWVSKTTHPVEGLAAVGGFAAVGGLVAKPDGLSLTPRPHVVEGKRVIPESCVSPPQVYHSMGDSLTTQ